jgi:hypothetical protein
VRAGEGAGEAGDLAMPHGPGSWEFRKHPGGWTSSDARAAVIQL